MHREFSNRNLWLRTSRKKIRKMRGRNLAGGRGFLPRTRTFFDNANVSTLNLFCGNNAIWFTYLVPYVHVEPFYHIGKNENTWLRKYSLIAFVSPLYCYLQYFLIIINGKNRMKIYTHKYKSKDHKRIKSHKRKILIFLVETNLGA